MDGRSEASPPGQGQSEGRANRLLFNRLTLETLHILSSWMLPLFLLQNLSIALFDNLTVKRNVGSFMFSGCNQSSLSDFKAPENLFFKYFSYNIKSLELDRQQSKQLIFL